MDSHPAASADRWKVGPAAISSDTDDFGIRISTFTKKLKEFPNRTSAASEISCPVTSLRKMNLHDPQCTEEICFLKSLRPQL